MTLEIDLDWLTPDNYGEPVESDAKEPPIVKLALEVMDKPEDIVLREWIQLVYPQILDYFSFKPGKGMSEEAANTLIAKSTSIKPGSEDKILGKLVSHEDQSLAVHLLNAALGGWTLVKLAQVNELEQRLYLAAVTLHDLNKIVLPGLGSVRMDGVQWQAYGQAVQTWGETLGLWKFISRDYWQDIAFLAQNAESSRGENLTAANHPETQLSPGHLTSLAEFVQFADLTASIAKRPNDLEKKEAVQAIVFRKIKTTKYHIRYHRTLENKGLITQAIHNVVLKRAKTAGWIPFLFFPDGITYFAPKFVADPELSNLADEVRDYIIKIVEKGLEVLVTRQNKGVIGHNPTLKELADFELAAKVLIRKTFSVIGEKKTPVTAQRREKIRSQFPDLSDLNWEYPSNLEVDRLGEGLRGIIGLLKDYYNASDEKATRIVLRTLDLEEFFEHWKRIPSDNRVGGVPHSWYYLAGQYIRQHPGLDSAEVEKIMLSSVQKIVEEWGKPEHHKPFQYLDPYISAILDLGQYLNGYDFLRELRQYQRNKARGRRQSEAVCVFCNSNSNVQEEYDSYTNKRVTSSKSSSKSVRGVCEICRIENLLRKNSFGRGLSPDENVTYLHLYPDYFFTPETASIMDYAYQRFARSDFLVLDKELNQYEYAAKYAPRADIFKVKTELKQGKKPLLDKVEYPRGQMQGYYLLGVPYLGASKQLTDTKAWYMTALLGLMAPIVFGVKVVASRSTLPPYDSGADFRETVVLDGVHGYWQHGMRKTRFRLDELETAIPAALSIYTLTAQAYLDSQKHPAWNSLNSVARSIDASPLYVFQYADRILEHRKKKKNKVKDPSIYLAEDLLLYHKLISDYYGGDDLMKMIGTLVDKYACFYRAKGFAAYARLRPLNEAAKRVLESPPQTSPEDLKLMLEGYLLSLVDGVLDRKVEGFIPNAKEIAKEKVTLISDFVQYFLDQVFYDYCKGERAFLRQNINLIRHAAEAYYIKHYLKKSDD